MGDKLLNNYVLEEPMCLNYNDKFNLIVGGMLQFGAANYFFFITAMVIFLFGEAQLQPRQHWLRVKSPKG